MCESASQAFVGLGKLMHPIIMASNNLSFPPSQWRITVGFSSEGGREERRKVSLQPIEPTLHILHLQPDPKLFFEGCHK